MFSFYIKTTKLILIVMLSLLQDIMYMNLWGVAVHELDSHPDHNKGPDHAPCVYRPIP